MVSRFLHKYRVSFWYNTNLVYNYFSGKMLGKLPKEIQNWQWEKKEGFEEIKFGKRTIFSSSVSDVVLNNWNNQKIIIAFLFFLTSHESSYRLPELRHFFKKTLKYKYKFRHKNRKIKKFMQICKSLV